MRAPRLLVIVMLGLLVTSGCSLRSSPSMAKATVEQTLSDRLQALVGQKPDKIECPGYLKGVVGTAMRCELTAGGIRLGVNLTVTRVEGETIFYDFRVDDLPRK